MALSNVIRAFPDPSNEILKMSKIAKLIRSALNNSSANEAAQALKIAAATMQKEGINPAEFLQEKGAEQPQRPDQSAELREAKELAIKWHRIAQEKDGELTDLAVQAVKLAELEKSHYNRAVDWKNRCLWGGVFALCAVVIAWGSGNSSGEKYGKRVSAGTTANQLFEADQKIAQLQADNKFLAKNLESAQAALNSATAAPKTPADNGTAVCTAIKANQYGVKMRFTYSPVYKVGVWVKGAKTGNQWENITEQAIKDADPIPANYTRDQFLTDVKKEFPGNMNCKLGVIKQ